jgi:NADPH oxidase
LQAFEWFLDILKALEDEDVHNFLEIHQYLTAPLTAEQVANLQVNNGGADSITGLKSPTYFGRPNFDQVFLNIRERHHGKKIGVFFCGPKPISEKLHVCCNIYSQPGKQGTKFDYHKENF